MIPPNQDPNHGLDGAFAAFRAHYTEQPPTHIEAALRARIAKPRHHVGRGLAIAAALAAAALLVLALLKPNKTTNTPVPRILTAHVAPPQPLTLPNPSSVAAPQTKSVIHRRRKHPETPQEQAQTQDPMDVRDFVSVPYAEPLAPSEQVDVYRVQLSSATLTRYGFPALPTPSGMPIPAEVAVGSDGLVRAIRFDTH